MRSIVRVTFVSDLGNWKDVFKMNLEVLMRTMLKLEKFWVLGVKNES